MDSLEFRQIIEIDKQNLDIMTNWMYNWRGKEDGYTFDSVKCFLENKEVKLVSFDYYNEEILNLLKELGEVKIVRLAAMFMNNHYMQDLVVAYFIERLINNGKIKVIKYGEHFFENVITINE